MSRNKRLNSFKCPVRRPFSKPSQTELPEPSLIIWPNLPVKSPQPSLHLAPRQPGLWNLYTWPSTVSETFLEPYTWPVRCQTTPEPPEPCSYVIDSSLQPRAAILKPFLQPLNSQKNKQLAMVLALHWSQFHSSRFHFSALNGFSTKSKQVRHGFNFNVGPMKNRAEPRIVGGWVAQAFLLARST